ncbi:DUF305 domain-containing protein [Robinsoniella peoriensis]|uniref:DUF305 domain-containing protein n=1 Tax=Robinsoniella peoriensis TaxID=180332 RepID=A0A4U8QAQ8_9FIRM|nr:DUF305 domain-containing protein [Robinsoniella peoriensis]MDU7031046.1 DUF305 domain-containing protein [Clostridiales bacterium]TLD02120.1 hypothetical protein DSM106044_00926 [Robinsoniella peoriensis]
MTNTCQLSNNTKAYVEQYHCILENMIQKMSGVKLTESISGSFITQMIPHHCAAIAMSENLLRYTTNIPLQNIAMNIIVSQQKSIENMKAVYPECQCCMNEPEELSCYKQNNDYIIQNMFYEMKAASTDNNIDANFMREMIPHHKGAVYMSENALQFPICSSLVPLLDAIVTSQKEGIRKMQNLLRLEINCT